MSRARSLLLLFSVAGFVGILKGLPYTIVEGSEFYWLFSYRDGFLRRALVGTLAQPATTRWPIEQLKPAIVALHATACVLIVCALAAIFWRAIRSEAGSKVGVTLALAFLCLMSSQLMPILAHDAGTVDVFLVLIVIAGFWLVLLDRCLAAALTFMIGPFIHEAFMFVGSPVLVILAWSCLGRGPARARKLVAIALPIASLVVILLFHDAMAEQRAIAALPLGKQIKGGLATHVFGETVLSAFEHMRAYEFPNNLRDASALAAFMLIPSTLMLWAAVFCFRDRWRSPVRTLLVMIAATLAPLAILAIAWDLVRFLAWSNLAAGLVLVASGTPGLLAAAESRP